MDSRFSAARAAVIIAGGVMLLAATSTADAQRREPAATARKRSTPVLPPAGPIGLAGTRFRQGQLDRRDGQFDRRRVRKALNNQNSGFFFPGYGFGYYPSVYNTNGVPLSESYQDPPPTGGYGYTPDLSGSPYVVSEDGQMLVEFASGDRRAFRSCAETADQRDPQGRPRTIFYRSPDAWMIQRPGQRGRVRGEPPTGRAACYAVDAVGRMVLRY
jgi:hypothetical protein